MKNDLGFIRKNDFEKLIFSYWLMTITLLLYVLISGNEINYVITNTKLIKICNFIDSNIVFNIIFRIIMYYLSYIFICFSILRTRITKSKFINVSVIIFVVWICKWVLREFSFSNYFDFAIFIYLIFYANANWKRSLIGGVLTFLYTLFNSVIKGLCITTLDFSTINTSIALIFSIDMYLMYFTIYSTIMYRKERDYGNLATILQIKQKVENYFCCTSNSASRCVSNNRDSSSIDYYHLYCGIIFTCLTYLSLLVIGVIFNRWIEMTISVVYFHFFRGIENKTYHSKTDDIKCWIVSMINFCIIMKLTLPIHISYLTSIALSYILCIVMRICYYISEKIKFSKIKNRRDKILHFVNNDEEEIEKLCDSLCLKDMSEIIYLYLNNTIEETSNILEIPVRTINNKINKFITKLESAE